MIETVKSKKMKREEYIGQKFNMLTVLGIDHVEDKSAVIFKCKCDCGNIVLVPLAGLRSGNNKSCGCLHKKVKQNIGKHRKDQTTHGGSRTRLYRIWAGMNNRCRSKDNPNNKRYGGRGITVCEEWRDFEKFREWALSNGYNDNLTIDRIDVNGNYEPDNCRWADRKLQGNNRENTFYVDYKGKKMPLKQVCEIEGIPYHTVWKRLQYYGMTLDDALHTPRIHGRKLCND